jgi:CheY-like chemotaxis protein
MKKVLDVGQCAADHGAIRSLIERNFDARVDAADDVREALDKLRGERYDLVLVNRLLDLDASEGMEIIRAVKSDPDLASATIMLVTNYPEHQAAAVAAGAEPGFGKAQLHDRGTFERLVQFLN